MDGEGMGSVRSCIVAACLLSLLATGAASLVPRGEGTLELPDVDPQGEGVVIVGRTVSRLPRAALAEMAAVRQCPKDPNGVVRDCVTMYRNEGEEFCLTEDNLVVDKCCDALTDLIDCMLPVFTACEQVDNDELRKTLESRDSVCNGEPFPVPPTPTEGPDEPLVDCVSDDVKFCVQEAILSSPQECRNSLMQEVSVCCESYREIVSCLEADTDRCVKDEQFQLQYATLEEIRDRVCGDKTPRPEPTVRPTPAPDGKECGDKLIQCNVAEEDVCDSSLNGYSKQKCCRHLSRVVACLKKDNDACSDIVDLFVKRGNQVCLSPLPSEGPDPTGGDDDDDDEGDGSKGEVKCTQENVQACFDNANPRLFVCDGNDERSSLASCCEELTDLRGCLQPLEEICNHVNVTKEYITVVAEQTRICDAVPEVKGSSTPTPTPDNGVDGCEGDLLACYDQFTRRVCDSCCDEMEEYLSCTEPFIAQCSGSSQIAQHDLIRDTFEDSCEEEGDGEVDVVNPLCFPAHATVQLEDGREKRMDQVEVGDVVHVGHGQYSRVFSWGHLERNKRAEYVRLEAGDQVLELSAGHYLPVDGRLTTADLVAIGGHILLGNGTTVPVTASTKAVQVGVYNPHTLHGSIVVNGVVTSIYTKELPPRLAHMLLGLPRLAYRCGLGDVLGTALHSSLPTWATNLLPTGPAQC